MTGPAPNTQRLLALDIFRGMTIFFMVIVNTPGSWSYVYAPLRHAEWDGLTPTDLVFPFFVFIVGVAMSFSFKKFSESSNKAAWYSKVLRRTALIFLVGLLLNWLPFFNKSIEELRIFGVLQRIALAYGLAAVILMNCPRSRLPFVFVPILVGYFALLLIFGGEDPLSLKGNAVRSLDLWLLGEKHLYAGYGIPFDPEGLLSTLPTAGTVLFGYWIGLVIQAHDAVRDKIQALVPYGVVATLTGVALHFLGCPINKPIWSSSYVLVAGGLATLFLIGLLVILDLKQWRAWSWMFEAFGKNPLASFVASSVTVKLLALVKIGEQGLYGWTYSNFFQSTFGNYAGSLLQAITFAMLIWIFAWILYRKNIVIKL